MIYPIYITCLFTVTVLWHKWNLWHWVVELNETSGEDGTVGEF
jgi:hypothetical protein